MSDVRLAVESVPGQSYMDGQPQLRVQPLRPTDDQCPALSGHSLVYQPVVGLEQAAGVLTPGGGGGGGNIMKIYSFLDERLLKDQIELNWVGWHVGN